MEKHWQLMDRSIGNPERRVSIAPFLELLLYNLLTYGVIVREKGEGGWVRVISNQLPNSSRQKNAAMVMVLL
jgi:hypothetical protein